jgi:hypothetical protein
MNDNETIDNQNFKFLNQNESDYYDKRIKKFLDDKDINSLIDILQNDPDSTTCLEAAEALAKLGDERGMDYLIAAKDSKDTSISWEAEGILSELNIPKEVLALVDILNNNTDLMESLEAAMALSQLGDERGVNFLITLLIFPDPRISSQARKFLIELNNPEGNAALHSLQNDANKIDEPKKISIRKYSFLAGYIVYTVLTLLTSVLLGFTPLPSLIRFVLILAVGYYIYKFSVNKTVLSFT